LYFIFDLLLKLIYLLYYYYNFLKRVSNTSRKSSKMSMNGDASGGTGESVNWSDNNTIGRALTDIKYSIFDIVTYILKVKLLVI